MIEETIRYATYKVLVRHFLKYNNMQLGVNDRKCSLCIITPLNRRFKNTPLVLEEMIKKVISDRLDSIMLVEICEPVNKKTEEDIYRELERAGEAKVHDWMEMTKRLGKHNEIDALYFINSSSKSSQDVNKRVCA